MLGRLLNNNRSRIDLDGLSDPVEHPEMPPTTIRKSGLLGYNRGDVQHQQILFRDEQMKVETSFREALAGSISHEGIKVISKAILESERLVDDLLPDGSLAQDTAEQMLQADRQILAQGHVAGLQYFFKESLKARGS